MHHRKLLSYYLLLADYNYGGRFPITVLFLIFVVTDVIVHNIFLI